MTGSDELTSLTLSEQAEGSPSRSATLALAEQLLDSTGEQLVAAFRVDAAGSIELVLANDAFRSTGAGKANSTPIGKKLESLVHYFGVDAESDENAVAHIARASRDKRPAAFIEYRAELGRSFLSRVTPLWGSTGYTTHLAYSSSSAVSEPTELSAGRRVPVAAAFRSNPTPTLLFDLATGEILELSESYARCVRMAREHLVGKSVVSAHGWHHASVRDEFLAQLRAGGSVERFEAILCRGDGTEFWGSLSASVVPHCSPPLAICSISDVSGQKRAEHDTLMVERQTQRTEKLEALGTLARGVAHDFNNIMGSIVARSALISADAGDALQVRNHVEQIKIASNRAKALVRRILTFSQNIGAERTRVDLGLVVSEALDVVHPTLPATTTLSLQVAADAPEVLADPTQVHQVIVNLCTNAAQAMPLEGGRISIQIDSVYVDPTMAAQVNDLRCGQYARAIVTDTGCGMDPVTTNRIFEPFFTTKPPGQGTGLGLAVVHGVMRANDGAILVDSAPGAGACFQLFFPAYATQSTESEQARGASTRGTTSLHSAPRGASGTTLGEGP